MKFFKVSAFSLAILALLISLLVVVRGTDDTNKALNYAKKACDGGNDLTYQARTNLAAEANSLDSRWALLYDSLSSLAAIESLNANKGSWRDAPGNDGVQMNYINAKQYSIFAAECTKSNIQSEE